jgi:hypothetical protein
MFAEISRRTMMHGLMPGKAAALPVVTTTLRSPHASASAIGTVWFDLEISRINRQINLVVTE